MTYRDILTKTLAIKAKYNLTRDRAESEAIYQAQLEAVYMVLTGESIYIKPNRSSSSLY